jgi:hypothetical protein
MDPPRAPLHPPPPTAADSSAAWVAAFRDFDALLDQPAEAREPRIAELRRDDPGRAEALTRLLAAHAARERGQGHDWLESLPALPSPGAADAAGGRQPVTGGRLGPWRLVSELGRGGMSRVWVARRDDIPWSREVALKVPIQVPLFADADGADPWQRELHQRFVRERDLLSRLEHPHIARLYDAGFADGVPWLALERVDGEDIVTWCARRSLTLRERVALFRQATQAVAYAHAALVVHRDLKPGNILVTADGSVRLLDFGIARLMDPADLGAPSDATRTLLRPMTPAYASPEQLRQEPLTTATDVYSLGLVLYELLSGANPFLGRRRTASEIERDIVEGRIAPASRAAAAATGAATAARARALRGDLDAVLARAMHPQVEGRYPSVAAFDADLAHWLAGEPVQARATPWWRRAVLLARRHPVASGAGAVATAAVLGSAGVALVQADQAREQAARAEATRDFVVRLFEGADPRLTGARDVPARDLLEAAERRLQERAAGDPALETDLLAVLGRLWWQSGDANRAAEVYARRTARLAERGDALAQAQSLLDEARAAALRDRWPRATEAVSQATALTADRPLPPVVAGQIALMRGWIALDADQEPESARRWLEDAVTRFRDGAAASQELEARGRLAEALLQAGDSPAAWDQHARIDDLLGAHTDLPTLDVLVARQARVKALWGAGRFRDGWPAVEAVLAETIRRLGPDTALEHEFRGFWLAWLLVLERPDVAARWFAEDPRRVPTDVAAQGADLVDSRIAQLVRSRAQSGDDPGALAAARLGADALRAVEPIERLRVVRALAEAHLLANRPQQALDTLAAWQREVARGTTAQGVEGAGDAALRLGIEAAAWTRLGDDRRAVERWQASAERVAQRWGADHPYRAFAAMNLLAARLRADAAGRPSGVPADLRDVLDRAGSVFAQTLPPTHSAVRAVTDLREALGRAEAAGSLQPLLATSFVADRSRFLR